MRKGCAAADFKEVLRVFEERLLAILLPHSQPPPVATCKPLPAPLRPLPARAQTRPACPKWRKILPPSKLLKPLPAPNGEKFQNALPQMVKNFSPFLTSRLRLAVLTTSTRSSQLLLATFDFGSRLSLAAFNFA